VRLAILEDLTRDLAADAADLALEVTYAALHRVVVDDLSNRVLADLDVDVFETCVFLLARHEIAHRDVELFELGVTADLEDLHTIAERKRNATKRVRRGDEHHLGQVIVEIEVVIVEVVVLLRIEHLEQRGGRVAAEVG
jgi:hypothetical protein